MARRQRKSKKPVRSRQWQEKVQQASEMMQSGQYHEAEELYKAALDDAPGDADLLKVLASLAVSSGSYDQAAKYYDMAIKAHPDDPSFIVLKGRFLYQTGQTADAMDLLKKAAGRWPHYVPLLTTLASFFKDQGSANNALVCLTQLLKIEPEEPRHHCNLGNLFLSVNNNANAQECFNRAITLPDCPVVAHALKAVSTLPLIYTTQDEMTATPARYKQALDTLVKKVNALADDERDDMFASLANTYPYYLAPLDINVKPLIKQWGMLIDAVAPEPPPMQVEPVKGRRIKVGFVSSHFRNHSVYKIPLGGWLEQLNKDTFELYGFALGQTIDAATSHAKKHIEKFVRLAPEPEIAARQITSFAPDILIYPEIGMDSKTIMLAAQKLAPVQMATLGHPVTTGLKTMDVYLSSALMEPENAQAHYTENLVSLPGTGCYYTPVENASNKNIAPMDKTIFDVDKDAVVFAGAQTICKYLPEDDEVFAQIATRLPHARFAFIQHQNQLLTNAFEERLTKAFEKHGLDKNQVCFFVPRMDAQHFSAFLRMCDVFVDTVGWSANNSAMEALSHHLPVITTGGKTMRARHSAGILHELGMPELIAATHGELVDIAVELGTNEAMRNNLRQKIQQNLPRLFEDKRPVKKLEQLIMELTGSA